MLTSDWITTITAQFNQLPSKELSELSADWDRFALQHHLYTAEPLFPEFNTWRTDNNRFRKHLKKIFYALQAIKEIDLLELSKQEKNDLLFHLMLIIKINLSKIELTQLRKLELDFPTRYDDSLDQLKKTHMQHLHELEKSLNEKKFSRSFDVDNFPYLHRIFKKHEKNTIDFKKHIESAIIVGAGTGLTSSSYSLTTKIAEQLPALLKIGSVATASLSVIPIINCIVVGAYYVLNAVKTWMNKQSPQKKGIATGSAVIVIGGMIAAGFLTAAAAGITAALTGIGLIFTYIVPWKKSRDQLLAKEKEFESLNSRIEQLSDNKNEKELSLESREKCALMKAIDHYLQSNQVTLSAQEITEAKDCIRRGCLEEVASNKLVKEAIANKELKGYLLKSNSNQKYALDEIMQKSRSEYEKKTAHLVNGVFSFVGVVMLCIPFPPIMILGASLIIASTIADIIIRFDIVSKVKNFFGKLFNGDTTDKLDNKDDSKFKLKSMVELRQQENVEEKKPAKKVSFEMKSRKERFSLGQQNIPVNDSTFRDDPTDPGNTPSKNSRH